MRFFGKKSKNFKVGKMRKYDEKGGFFRDKRSFHFFKSLLYKNGKVQNMPMVAGRLISTSSSKAYRRGLICYDHVFDSSTGRPATTGIFSTFRICLKRLFGEKIRFISFLQQYCYILQF